MDLRNFFALFHHGNVAAKSHIKNLIEVASADGEFNEQEFYLLKDIARRNNISDKQLDEIRCHPEAIIFICPSDDREKFYQLYDLVHMMMVDDFIHPEEIQLCNVFAMKFGYPDALVNEIITTIQLNIENGSGYDETMKRIYFILGR